MTMMRRARWERMTAGALVLGLALAFGGVTGCEDQNAFERAGEEIDEAIEDAKAGGETFGNRLDDAVDELREGAEDAKKKLQAD